VLGPMQVASAAWPHCKKQRHERVVNFTSKRRVRHENSTAYMTSKEALLGLTRSLALEEEPNDVTVIACAPVAYPPMVMNVFEVLPRGSRSGSRVLPPQRVMFL
jgi:NAD(P)-dependent dehydrogenase (short-subunit alcohol dehydrogenase family)